MKRRSSIISPRRCFGSCVSAEGPLVPTSYRYRLLKGASWGIAIDLRAEALPPPAAPVPPGARRVAEGVWLQADPGWPLTEEELAFMELGLQLVADGIAARRPGASILVRVVGLDFDPRDYQPEGLAAAIAEWAAQEFGFAKPEIPVSFDPDRNRYVFRFGRAEGRPGRSAAAGS
jgi:hypothetical protein